MYLVHVGEHRRHHWVQGRDPGLFNKRTPTKRKQQAKMRLGDDRYKSAGVLTSGTADPVMDLAFRIAPCLACSTAAMFARVLLIDLSRKILKYSVQENANGMASSLLMPHQSFIPTMFITAVENDVALCVISTGVKVPSCVGVLYQCIFIVS